MVFVRLVVLVFLTWWAWELGHIPNPNAFGSFMGGMFFLLGPLLYFLPTIEAALRDTEKTLPIGMLNFLLGWTLIGWVASYIWALSAAVKGAPAQAAPGAAGPAPAVGLPTRAGDVECPHCAELIKPAAKVCKHCGRDVAPAA